MPQDSSLTRSPVAASVAMVAPPQAIDTMGKLEMVIEIERGWVRLGDRAVYWTGPRGYQCENRQLGDPWFEWKTDPEEGAGHCWLGRLQVQWEYPPKAALHSQPHGDTVSAAEADAALLAQ